MSNWSDGRYWAGLVRTHGEGLVESLAQKLESGGDLTEESPNTLTMIGKSLSQSIRRKILLNMLVDTEWNLSRVARRLFMANATVVARAIVELDLASELARARVRGLSKAGRWDRKAKARQ